MPSGLSLGREVVRATPYAAQFTRTDTVVFNGSGFAPIFDLAISLTDRVQLQSAAAAGFPSVGPYLDVAVISTGVGTLDVLIAIDVNMSAISMLAAPYPIVANTLLMISALRIPARLVEVVYSNTSGGNATTTFGAYIRSN